MKRMEYEEFAEAREARDLRLIDVREKHEFDEVHVIGAEFFPLSRIQQGELPQEDEREIAIICRSGGRSAVAAQIFEREGFRECINIEGGTIAAVQAGPEHVEKG